MGRLIDEAVLLDKHAEQCGEKSCDTCRFIGKEKCASYMAITETPTAFNVEAVVKEVQDIGTRFCTVSGCNCECECCDHGSIMKAVIDAIRKGGVKNG